MPPLKYPANLLLKKIGTRIWLPGIKVAWGIVTTCISTVDSYHGLLAGRIFLGVAESGKYPGVPYYFVGLVWPTGSWIRKFAVCILCGRINSCLPFIEIWSLFSAAEIAGAFSGLSGYAISKMDGISGYEGWRWM
jgi:hypothetical protein